MEFNCEKAVKYLQSYINTYPVQYNYEKYGVETFIDDIIYGLGVAIDEDEYEYASGFDSFKKRLVKHFLGTDPPQEA